jgi:hypothetical protein
LDKPPWWCLRYICLFLSQKKHRQTMIKPYCSFVSLSKKTTISPLKKKTPKKLAGCFLKTSCYDTHSRAFSNGRSTGVLPSRESFTTTWPSPVMVPKDWVQDPVITLAVRSDHDLGMVSKPFLS